MNNMDKGYLLPDPNGSHPFWGNGEDSDVNMIYMDVAIEGGHGTPQASITKSVSGHDILFHLLLKYLEGAPGADGFSPTITITSITGGHRVSITDKTSTHVFDVMNGEPGQNGTSPDVSVTDIIGGHRVTITDATGSESFDVMDGTQGEAGTTPEITITATQDGQPVTVTKTGTDAAPNFNIALTGGGGSASGVIGWGNYGTEIAGRYPRAIKEEYKLSNPITVNSSGTNSTYISGSGSHEYSWTLTGELPTNFEVDTKYTPEMAPSEGGHGYFPAIYGDVTPYLTATITPQDEMTVDNIRVKISSSYEDYSDHSLHFTVNIDFNAHYNGQDSPDNTATVSLKANPGEFALSSTYAYLEILPEV